MEEHKVALIFIVCFAVVGLAFAFEVRNLRRKTGQGVLGASVTHMVLWMPYFVLTLGAVALVALCALCVRLGAIQPIALRGPSVGDALTAAVSSGERRRVLALLATQDYDSVAGWATTMPDIVLAQSVPPEMLDASALNKMARALLKRGKLHPLEQAAAARWSLAACALSQEKDPRVLLTAAHSHRAMGATVPQAGVLATGFHVRAVTQAQLYKEAGTLDAYKLTEEDIDRMRADFFYYPD